MMIIKGIRDGTYGNAGEDRAKWCMKVHRGKGKGSGTRRGAKACKGWEYKRWDEGE